MTYEGLIKLLYVSRNKNAKHFRSWATETLFTVQMGTIEQKNKLVAKIKGVSYDTIQELFSINAREMPCVYLTALNTVEVLRNEMNIDMSHSNDSIVYKYGLTTSFESRKNGHNQEFKKIDHLIDKKLVYYTIIDPLYLSKAETEIKTMMEDNKIKWDNHDELVIIPNNMMKYVKKIFETIGLKYSGHTTELTRKIQELEMTIQTIQLKHENELKLKDKDIEILHKEIQFKDREIKFREQENELLSKLCKL